MILPADDRRAPSLEPARGRRWLVRIGPLLVLGALALLVFAMGWHRQVSFETLALHHIALDRMVAEHGAAALAAFVALYVAVIALSIPGALILTITSGLLFGTVSGALASIVGATIGATVLFLVARTACGEYLVRRAGPQAIRLAEGFREDAFSYLMFLRLVPVFPFFLVNLVAAIAGVRLAPFVAATALGIVPAAFVLAFFGAGLHTVLAAQEAGYRGCLANRGAGCRIDFDLSSVFTPNMVLGLAGLGVLALTPVVLKRLRARRIAKRSS